MNTTTLSEADAKHIQPGTIWVSVWGYEAVIASWAVVTRSTDKCIWLAEIDSVETGDWVAGTSMPKLPAVKIGSEKRYNLRDTQYGLSVKRNDYSSIRPWSGSPIHTYNWH